MGAVIAAVLLGTLAAGTAASMASNSSDDEPWRIAPRWEDKRWKISELLTPGPVRVVAKDLNLDAEDMVARLGRGLRVFVLADKQGPDHVLFTTNDTGRLQTYLGFGRTPATREAERALFAWVGLQDTEQPHIPKALPRGPKRPELPAPQPDFEIQPVPEPIPAGDAVREDWVFV